MPSGKYPTIDGNRYPNIARLDSLVGDLLATPQAKDWSITETEQAICKIHPIYYLHEHTLIRPKEIEGGMGDIDLIPFILNPSQLYLADMICRHFAVKPWGRVQINVLKYRQGGISTLGVGITKWLMRFVSNLSAFHIADVGKHTDNLQLMLKTFQESDTLPGNPCQVPMPRNKQGLLLSNGSICEADSGDNSNPGTSQAILVLHMSENSKWRDPENAETSLLNTLPRQGFAFVLREATAFGMNKFYHDVENAVKGDSRWEHCFLPWFDHPDAVGIPPEELDLDEEEVRLQATHNLSNEQLQFRRDKIGELGDVQRFKQDYPSDWREPFLLSGSNYFDVELVQRRIDRIKFYRAWKSESLEVAKDWYPGVYASLSHDRAGIKEALVKLDMRTAMERPMRLATGIREGRVTYTLEPKGDIKKHGLLAMYREPTRRHKYLFIVDPAEGKKSDEYTSDDSVIIGFDLYTKEQVAEWGGTFDEEVTATYAVMLAKLYNDASLVVEMNNKCGGMVLALIDRMAYRNLYCQEKIGKNQVLSREPGWRTTRGNKKETCAQLKLDFKNDKCILNSVRLLEEMLFFVEDGLSLEAAKGHTDDRVMAASVGLRVMESTPGLREGADPHHDERNRSEPQIVREYEEAVLAGPLNKNQAVLERYM